MSVKLYIVDGQKRAELELSKANNLQVLNIIRGLFGFMGFEVKCDVAPRVSNQITEHEVKIDVHQPLDQGTPDIGGEPLTYTPTSVENSIGEETASKEPSEEQGISRKLPYVNGGHTLSQSLGDVLGPLLKGTAEGIWLEGEENSTEDTAEQPSVVMSTEKSLIEPKENLSIREIGGILHYQTYVYCKNLSCGKRNKIFIKEQQTAVYCPACNTKHARRDASKDGFPTQDDFGNYFKADRLWIQNLRPHQERIKSPIK